MEAPFDGLLKDYNPVLRYYNINSVVAVKFKVGNAANSVFTF